jgi:hypothetical protein
MAASITLAVRDDNSTEDAEKVVKWASKFGDVEAFIVFDYVQVSEGREAIAGTLNGVTVQWSHVEEVIDYADADGDGDTTDLIHRVSAESVHVRPGGTLRRVGKGFTVENLPRMAVRAEVFA